MAKTEGKSKSKEGKGTRKEGKGTRRGKGTRMSVLVLILGLGGWRGWRGWCK